MPFKFNPITGKLDYYQASDNSAVGDLENLSTTDKDTLVAAINELVSVKLGVADVDLSDIMVGEQKITTIKKQADGSAAVGDPINQIDKIVSSTFETLLADTKPWIGEELILTGENYSGELGQQTQEYVMPDGTFMMCIGHDPGTDGGANGSATWKRNRTNYVLKPGNANDDNVIAALKDETGWDGDTQTKVITFATGRCKASSWYVDANSTFYFCYEETGGTSWSWKRIGTVSDAIPMEITATSHPILTANLQAHDFATNGWYDETSDGTNETAQHGQRFVDYTTETVYERLLNNMWRKA